MGWIIPLATAGVEAAGQYEQGQAAKKNADYQSQVALNNATIAKQNATYEGAIGEQKAENNQLRERSAMATQKAAQGANNLDVNTGSNLASQVSAQEVNALDTSTIKTEAARSAWNYQTQAQSATAESQLLKKQGGEAETASYVGMGTSLLSGASQALYFNWMYSNPNTNPPASP